MLMLMFLHDTAAVISAGNIAIGPGEKGPLMRLADRG